MRVCVIVILFNDGHVLQLRSETVAVRRRMNMVLDYYDGQMIPGDDCGLNFLTFALQLRKTPENPQPGNRSYRGSYLGPLREKQRRYLGHSGGLFVCVCVAVAY